jgi:hypothetical protein
MEIRMEPFVQADVGTFAESANYGLIEFRTGSKLFYNISGGFASPLLRSG